MVRTLERSESSDAAPKHSLGRRTSIDRANSQVREIPRATPGHCGRSYTWLGAVPPHPDARRSRLDARRASVVVSLAEIEDDVLPPRGALDSVVRDRNGDPPGRRV